MSPSRRNEPNEPEVTRMAEEDDAEDPRTFEHPAAEAVRNGTLSAAQLPGGHGNVDPNEPDAQYPPGVVDNTPTAGDTGDPADFIPERKRDKGMSPTPSNVESAGLRTTAATPAYDSKSEE